MSYEMSADERHDVVVRAPFDERGVQFYLERREVGDSHMLSLGLALNDWREREKGLSWENYDRKINR